MLYLHSEPEVQDKFCSLDKEEVSFPLPSSQKPQYIYLPLLLYFKSISNDAAFPFRNWYLPGKKEGNI